MKVEKISEYILTLSDQEFKDLKFSLHYTIEQMEGRNSLSLDHLRVLYNQMVNNG